MRKYTIAEIIGPSMSNVKRTVSHYHWVNGYALDPTQKYLSDTVEGPRRFEVATGARVITP